MPWIRSGYCCRCGDCCKGDPYAGQDEDRSEAMKRTPPVPGYCPLYEIHAGASEGEGFCAGHEPPNQDKYYLEACSRWPDSPYAIADKPRCTYVFTFVEE